MPAPALSALLLGAALACGAALPPRTARFCSAQRQVECVFSGLPPTNPTPPGPESRKRKLLVFVVGVRERFYPIPTLRHVVAPAVRAGYIVDYYVMLSMKVSGSESFRTYWYAPVANPEFMNYTAEDMESYLVQRAKFYGARRAGVFLLPNNTHSDSLPQHIFTNKRFLAENSGIGTSGKFDSSGTFWLFLMRLKKVEMLWNWTAGHRMYNEYDHVFWTRSDAYWVDDVDMGHFPDRSTVYSRNFGFLCNKARGRSISDQSIVLGGAVAGQILTAYSAFYRNRDPRLNGARSSEGFMQALADVRGVPWKIVRQDWLPFFLALHMKAPDRKEPVLCFRGLTWQHVKKPVGECIHPSKIKAALCDELEIV